jgi:hypothetical protein
LGGANQTLRDLHDKRVEMEEAHTALYNIYSSATPTMKSKLQVALDQAQVDLNTTIQSETNAQAQRDEVQRRTDLLSARIKVDGDSYLGNIAAYRAKITKLGVKNHPEAQYEALWRKDHNWYTKTYLNPSRPR